MPKAKRISSRVSFILQLLVCIIIANISFSCTSSLYNSHYATASWYGPKFHGNQTSSGEIFNMYNLTCAHKKYAFGSELRVTNISNGRSVECIVNDRGPFINGRDIDLSYAAARKIGLINQGVGDVKIEYLGRDSSYVRRVSYSAGNGPYTVQVGSFKKHSNALHMKKSLEMTYAGVYILESLIRGSTYYRVRIGHFDEKDDVTNFAQHLADEGYTVLITKYQKHI